MAPGFEYLESRRLLATIHEFPIPTSNGAPAKLTAGPDGNVWFTELDGNAIGRITPAGVVTEFPIPTANSHPIGITTGPDGNLWFVENGPFSGTVHSKIGKIIPTGPNAGSITEFTIATFPSSPTSIAVGADGNLWFTEFDANRIGQITPSGTITEFRIPGSETEPDSIAAGADGNLWFTENNGMSIGQITPNGAITQFPYTDFTEEITAGPNDTLWFTDSDDEKVGRITLSGSGSVTTFPLPRGANLLGICGGPDGNVWIANRNANRIDQITPAGVVTSFPIPTATSNPTGVTTGPDGNIWFVENSSGKIGQIVVGSDLSLSGSAPGSVTLGQDVTYTFTITNNGTEEATGVTLTDTLPAGVTFVSATGGIVPVNGVFTLHLGDNLAAGSSVTINLVVTPTALGTLTNRADVSGNEDDLNPADNTVTLTTTVTAPVVIADLRLSESAPASVTLGQDVTYSFTVANNGPAGATGLALTDALPAGVTFVSATGGVAPMGGLLTFSLGNLAAGASDTVTVVVTPTAIGTLSNRGDVTSNESDPILVDNAVTRLTAVTPPIADLRLTGSAPASVTLGQNVTYSFTVTNNGPSGATGVTLTDTLPAAATFVSATGGVAPVGGVLTFSLGNLAAGASDTVTVVVTPTAIGTLSNRGDVTSNESDPILVDNTVTRMTAVTPPIADLRLTGSAPASVAAEQHVTYTLLVHNNGPAAATGVTLTDTLPPGVRFVSATGGVTPVGGVLTFALGNVPNGADSSVNIIVAPTVASTLSNRADVHGSQNDPSPADNTVFLTTRVQDVVVNTTDDESDPNDDLISLREAIAFANAFPGQTIIFDPAVFAVHRTITLFQALPDLSNTAGPETITGPAAGVTVTRSTAAGTPKFRLLTVDRNVSVSLSDLTLTGGFDDVRDDGGVESLGTLTATDCTISDNVGTGIANGDGSNGPSGPLTMINCTIAGNVAKFYGGGVYNTNGPLTMVNCTIAGNTALAAGGTAAFGGTLTLTNCTIAGNRSLTDAGGGIGEEFLGATVVLRNSIVAGNFQGAAPATTPGDIFGTVNPASTFNLLGTGGSGGLTTGVNRNIVGVDPILGPLQDNGGPTVTMALLDGSPAFNAGKNALLPASVTTDQRGLMRVFGGTVDIGAFESQRVLAAPSLVVNTTADELTVGDGLTSLREAVALANALGGGTITFDPAVFPAGGAATIELRSDTAHATLELKSNVTIVGPGASALAVKGGGSTLKFSVFKVDAGATAAISGLTVTGGHASANGGGILNDGTLSLTACAVTGNSADLDGGGISNGDFLTVRDCTLAGNSAGRSGGAIFTTNGKLSLTNCTVASNPAGASGGGIEAQGDVTVTCSTFSLNSAGFGGGIDNYFNGYQVTVADSILAGDSALYGGPEVANSVISLGNNLIGETDGSLGWIASDLTGTIAAPLDPLLAPLGNYGGPTMTMALLDGSPAFDAGSNALVPAGVTTDQRGLPRIFHGTVDIGAFESQTVVAPPSFVVNTTDDELTPGDGKTSLREAIAAANTLPGHTITFDPAVFPSGGAATIQLRGDAAYATLELKSNVTIVGPGASALAVQGGGSTSNFSVFKVDARATAAISGLTVTGGHVSANGGGIFNSGDLTLTDVAITHNTAGNNGGGLYVNVGTTRLIGGRVDDNSAGFQGGGIEAEAGTMTLTNTAVTNNKADATGGGIRNYHGTLTLTGVTVAGNKAVNASGGVINRGMLRMINCIVSDNKAGYNGGVINNSPGTVTMIGCTVSGNMATSGRNGGIGNDDTDVSMTLTNCTIANNKATTTGGGIGNNGVLVLSNCTVAANTATSSGGGIEDDAGTLAVFDTDVLDNRAGFGGGINSLGQLTLVDVNVMRNYALNYGGGISNSGTLTMNGSTVANNTGILLPGGGVSGAGIFNFGVLTMIDSTVSGNSAFASGGIHSLGPLTLTNCTVTGNQAECWGGIGITSTMTATNDTIVGNRTLKTSAGGILVAVGGKVRLNNTIVAGNVQGAAPAATPGDILLAGGTVDASSSFNLIGTGGSGGLKDRSVDPTHRNRVGVTNPGLGPLQDNGGPTQTMVLQIGSEAIDGGSNAFWFAAATDQRSLPRIVNGAVDIGAFEKQDVVLHAAKGGGVVDLVSTAGTALQSTVAIANPSPLGNYPAGLTAAQFPLGFFRFTLNLKGQTAAAVMLLLPPGAPQPTTYYKFGATPTNHVPHWYEFLYDGTTGAETHAQNPLIPLGQVVLHFVDGQRGDGDLSRNGIVVDPGGPALRPGSVPSHRTAVDAARAALVTTLYRDLLGRDPEPSGLSFWVKRLAAGVPTLGIATAIWRSPEHRYLEQFHAAPPISFHAAAVDAFRAWRQARNRFLQGRR